MISFFVKAIPKGQARPRVFSQGGRTIAYSPKCEFTRAVYAEAMRHRPVEPLDCALNLVVNFYMPRPQGVKKSVVMHRKRPDIDNIIKAVLDACSKARIWVDDSRVAFLSAKKQYVGSFGHTEAGSLVIISEAED